MNKLLTFKEFFLEMASGRVSYQDSNPGREEAIWNILIKFMKQNEDKGMSKWRFTNSEVVDELDQHPVYGIGGTNPWHSDSKEKSISIIRREWGIVDPHRKEHGAKGTKQIHRSGAKQTPLLKKETPPAETPESDQ